MKQHELFGDAPDPTPEAAPPAAPGDPARDAPPSGGARPPDARSAVEAPDGAGAPTRVTPPVAPSEPRSDDGEARLRAVTEFERPLLLRAGAGTGKTATLVARVAHWCLGPGWELERDEADPIARAGRVLRGVAAVTFTEAAAAEMATRVGVALADVQRYARGGGPLPVGFEPGRLPDDRDELGLRARALRATLDQLDVSTIHAFCRRILSAHALTAEMDPDFEVDATFRQAELAVRDALEELLRADWEAGRDQDWIELARRGFPPPQVEATLVELVTDQGARAADFDADPLPAEGCARLIGDLRARLAELVELASALEHYRAQERSVTGQVLENLEDSSLALAAVAAGADPRRDFVDLAGRLRAAWLEGDRERGWKRLKEWQRKLNTGEGKAVPDQAPFHAAARALRVALEPFLELDLELLELARRVVRRVLARVEELLRHRGVATFSELLSSARDLLRDPRVAARERGRIRQLLVDEFQDTDLEQCEIVAALGLPGPGEARGPGLFLVGDPKQSIFAWRNADLEAFDDFTARLVEAGGEVLPLSTNYRSHAAVLAEVERVVAPVMEAEHGLQPAFEKLSPGREGARGELGAPAVEHWLSWPRDPGTDTVVIGAPGRGHEVSAEETYACEARGIARDIVARHAAGEAWRDFAVIVRSMTGIDTYLRELREAGVPYEVPSDRKYYERREVVDAASLVRAVLDPTDHVALVGLLRSPAVGLPDAALFPLWEAGFPERMTWLVRPDAGRLDALEDLIESAARQVPEVPGLELIGGWERSVCDAVRAMAELRESFREEPVDRFVERLRSGLMTDVAEAARYLGEYRLAGLERFFRELVEGLEEAEGDARRVLRALRANVGRTDRTEASRPIDSGRDAVQVLTIHGSKGLEFPTVYLAQTHRSPRSEGRLDPGFERRGGRAAYRLFGAPSLDWMERKVRRAEVEAAERVRLLYVTLTRAERRLVILGAWPEGGAPKAWREEHTANGLIRSRGGSAEAVARVAEAARAGRFEVHVDADGVAWRLAELEPGTGRRPELRALEPAGHAEAILEEAGALAADRRRAERAMARPFSAAASTLGHSAPGASDGPEAAVGEGPTAPPDAVRGSGVPSEPSRPSERAERAAARRFEADCARGGPALGRDAALAAGTAIHGLLEELPLEGDLSAAFELALEGLADRVERLAAADQREAALERARELGRRIAGGALLGRLAELGRERGHRARAPRARAPRRPSLRAGRFRFGGRRSRLPRPGERRGRRRRLQDRPGRDRGGARPVGGDLRGPGGGLHRGLGRGPGSRARAAFRALVPALRGHPGCLKGGFPAAPPTGWRPVAWGTLETRNLDRSAQGEGGAAAVRIEDLMAEASWIRSLARSLVGDGQAADDVVQETWIAVLRRPPRGDRPLRPWLARVVTNFARMQRRGESSRRRREASVARGEALPSSEELVERVEVHQLLTELVVHLGRATARDGALALLRGTHFGRDRGADWNARGHRSLAPEARAGGAARGARPAPRGARRLARGAGRGGRFARGARDPMGREGREGQEGQEGAGEGGTGAAAGGSPTGALGPVWVALLATGLVAALGLFAARWVGPASDRRAPAGRGAGAGRRARRFGWSGPPLRAHARAFGRGR